MGFMDKAKKLAEQAQHKLDEAQQNFNQGGSTPGQQGATRYDEHGRPIQDAPPAGTAPPPSAEPAAPASPAAPEPPAAADPAAASAATEPTAPEPPDPPAPAAPPPSEGGSGSANATPDPFKPLQQ
jgi:hypothetical protein